MTRKSIILTILILVLITKFNSAISDQHDRGHEKTVYKCCPFGEYVDEETLCVRYNGTFTFSEIKVYSKKMKKTGKSVRDMFKLLPARFDDKFKAEALVPSTDIDCNEYINEDGILLLEMPNIYNRWMSIANANFCVDYKIIPEENVKAMHVWAIVTEVVDNDEENVNKCFTYTLLVSCFFMLLVLIVYGLLPELQNFAGMMLMAYVTSLFLAFLLLAVIKIKTHGSKTCIGLTLGIYFFLLASVCWMSVMSYDICCSVRSNYTNRRSLRSERVKFLKYCVYAWGVPLAMTIVLAVLNSVDMRHVPWFVTPNIPDQGCFLMGGIRLLYLHVPMLFLIICNWIFFLMTAVNLWRKNQDTAVLDRGAAGKPQGHRAIKNRFLVYLRLSVVMGLNWLLEVVSSIYPGFKMWYISDAYNILIGLAIFLIFVCKKKIYRMLCKRFSRKKNVTNDLSLKSCSATDSARIQSHSHRASISPSGTNSYSMTE